ncbi:MAG: diphosphate--fructose-6-phosphate 1-phosphotransferase, partial [Clostridia bacterium]
GIVNEDFIDLTNVSDDKIELLKRTPGSAIGTSRLPLEKSDYEKIVDILVKHDIKYVLFNGGNGSMDTCGNIYNLAREKGIICVGIPKTIDNDIMETDHAPGYASCARYLACSVKEAAQDIKGLPIHVSIIESMGRNVGWITAAAALARENSKDAPDFIYCPEYAFDEDKFLGDTENLFRKKGGVTIVASEGLRDAKGNPIVEPIFSVGRATYFGDVSSHLANLIIKKLGIKARSEKPGILQRASTTFASKVDVEEAFIAGVEAVKAALAGVSGVMVAFERVSTSPYVVKTKLVDIKKVMLTERTFPTEYLTENKNDVTQAFIDWVKPLVGEIPNYVSFLD